MIEKVTFSCKSCGGSLSVRRNQAHLRFRCHRCGTVQSGPQPSPGAVLDHKQSAASEPNRTPAANAAQQESPRTDQYRFKAFISYRHVDPDRKWARWLHAALETYRVPKAIVRERNVAQRLGRVFRDEEELSASASLSESIERALVDSQYLIVVCSPRAPVSKWVNQEITRFRELGRQERILSLLIEGEPQDSFPPALREIRRSGAAQLQENEPLAADVRVGRHERGVHLRRMARLRLLATILGCEFDDLVQRDRKRYRRRLVLWTSVTTAALAFAIVTLVAASQQVNLFQQIADLARGSAAKAEQEREAALKEKEHALRQSAKAQRDVESRLRDSEQRIAVAEQASLERARSLERLRYYQLVNQAQIELAAGDYEAAISTLGECPVEHRHFEHRYLSALAHPAFSHRKATSTRWSDSASWLRAKAYSPDKSRMAEFEHDSISLRDPKSGVVITHFSGPNGVGYRGTQLAFTSDGQRLVAILPPKSALSPDKVCTVCVWSVDDGRLISFSTLDSDHLDCYLSPEATRVIAGGHKYLIVWSVAQRKAVGALAGSTEIHRGVWSPTGRYFAGNYGGAVHAWEVSTGRHLDLAGPPKHSMPTTGHVAFAPDDTCLVGTFDIDHAAGRKRASEVRCWDLPEGAVRYCVISSEPHIQRIAFSHDGRRFATSAKSRAVRIWEVENGHELLQLVPETITSISELAFSEDDRVVGAADGSNAELWTARGDHPIELSIADHVRQISFSPDGRRLAVAGNDSITIWDWQQTSLVRTIVYEDSAQSIAYSPNGKLLAIGSLGNESIRIWDADSGTLQTTLRPGATTRSLSFTPDGSVLASGNGNGRIILWNLATAQRITTFEETNVRYVKWLPDGQRRRQLFSAGRGNCGIWEPTTGGRLVPLNIDDLKKVHAEVLSEDGQLFAAASSTGRAGRNEIEIWDLRTGAEIYRISIDNDIRSLAFHPSGRYLALGGYHYVTLCDVVAGQQLATVETTANVESLCFSSSGYYLAIPLSGGVSIVDLRMANIGEVNQRRGD